MLARREKAARTVAIAGWREKRKKKRAAFSASDGHGKRLRSVDMSNLKPVVLVTGASRSCPPFLAKAELTVHRGIGLAVVSSLLEEHGARVVALARSTTPELTQLVNAHPASLLAISCDV